MKRLKQLETEEFAFSQDSDTTPEQKAVKIFQRYKQKRLVVSRETEAALENLEDLHSDSEMSTATQKELNKNKVSKKTTFASNYKASSNLPHEQDDFNFSKYCDLISIFLFH